MIGGTDTNLNEARETDMAKSFHAVIREAGEPVRVAVSDAVCSTCQAHPSDPCVVPGGTKRGYHHARQRLAAVLQANVTLIQMRRDG